jgi:hypothetical protein
LRRGSCSVVGACRQDGPSHEYNWERPIDYRQIYCPLGEELMSGIVILPIIPSSTEDDVGEMIQVY